MLYHEERQTLIEEYRVLFSSIWERGRAVWLVNSVLIPSSILIVLQATIYRNNLGKTVVSIFSFLSFVLVLYCLLFYNFSEKVNKECWKRVNEIEEILGIKGNRLIYSKVHEKYWYDIRRAMWYVLLSSLVVANFIVFICNLIG